MIEAMEAKVPRDIARHIFKFLAHPTATLIADLLKKYTNRQLRWEALCIKYSRRDSIQNFTFLASVVGERKFSRSLCNLAITHR